MVPCRSAPPGGCRDEDIRLEGGSEDEEFGTGIINVCYTGLWGTVCGKDWDEMDGVVACRQLGYAELGEFSTYKAGLNYTELVMLSCATSMQSLQRLDQYRRLTAMPRVFCLE